MNEFSSKRVIELYDGNDIRFTVTQIKTLRRRQGNLKDKYTVMF